ncbi:uncharacterized protein LOC116260389 [Nymphaea colorata]|uniref:uncharacterized protein LOC116260389 n=1 Tax=Nymphaea colorata TaxID=210225 RepID=UPI00129D6571|nr:uncharacterized protein LOC116260389 [Nymphaea colorata]
MKVEEVTRCQIQEWYPKFKSVSIKTIIHQLPESFVSYLLQDSGPFLLPTSVLGEDALPNRIRPQFPCLQAEDYHPWDEEDDDDGNGDGQLEENQESTPPSFPELELKVKESIEALGGSVIPKLNWSAPKDAAWISTSGTLKCTSFSEVVLLLKSSDSVVHDLCHAFDSCEDKLDDKPAKFYLALRKWYAGMRPEMEFRCFVCGESLVGISQRDVTVFYPALLEVKKKIGAIIYSFFEDNLAGKFGSDNYVFDVYVTKDGRVKVLDFNPWGAFTLPLLFSWDELGGNSGGQKIVSDNTFEFRIIESKCGVRPGLKTAVPYDYIDTSAGSGWDEFLRRADDETTKQ